MLQSDIEKFIDDRRLNNIFNSPHTERSYRSVIESWYNHSQGKDDIETAKDYLKLISEKYASKGVKRSLYILKTFYDWLCPDSDNIFDRLAKTYQVNRKENYIKQMERDDRVYADDDVLSLLNKAEQIYRKIDPTSVEFYLAYRNWFIIFMMAEFGMRINGLLGADVSHIDFGRRILTIYDSKNGKPYPVPIKDHIPIIKRYLTIRNTIMFKENQLKYGSNALLVSHNGLRYNDTSARRAINTIAEEAGLYDSGRSTHQLRHYRATKYYREGMPTDLISQVMGVSVEVLKRTYLHLTDDDTVLQYENWLELKEKRKPVFHCPICGYSSDEEKKNNKPKLEVVK